MRNQTNQLYNILSITFLALSGVAIVIFAILLLQPPPQSDADVAELPTRFVPPTATATFTPSTTPTSTRTPFPTLTPSNTPTDLPEASNTPTTTLTPTIGASPTATITNTPAATATPAETDTPTPTATATGPSETPPPPLPYALLSEPTFTANTYNSAGCAWQGIGGQVLGIDQQPYTGPQLVVHVYTAGQDFPRVNTGTNSVYGNAGFEVAVAQQLIPGTTYFVDLETVNGTKIAPTVQVTFPGTCDTNVAILTFVQLR